MASTGGEPVRVRRGDERAAPDLPARPLVLVIDDEPLLGQTLRLGLADSMDVQVETAGEAGLARALGAEEFDLILCDLTLPDKPGGAIYAALSVLRPEVCERFVLMTGGAVNDEAHAFLDAYPGAVLNKPFSLTEVERIVFAKLASRGEVQPPSALNLLTEWSR